MNNRHGKRRREDMWSSGVLILCVNTEEVIQKISVLAVASNISQTCHLAKTQHAVSRLVCRKDLNRSKWFSAWAARTVFWTSHDRRRRREEEEKEEDRFVSMFGLNPLRHRIYSFYLSITFPLFCSFIPASNISVLYRTLNHVRLGGTV